MATTKTWYQKAWKAFQKRWVQVCVTLATGVLVAGVSSQVLGPRERARGDTTGFKFLHCDNCQMEMPFNPELDGKRCPRCKPPSTGYFKATESSIKRGTGPSSPWKWVYIACAFDALATLGMVVYLLYLPVPDPTTTFYVCNCPHCKQRMRFRQLSLGGIGMCPKCKRPVRFPDEDDAVAEVAYLKQQDEELSAADHEDE